MISYMAIKITLKVRFLAICIALCFSTANSIETFASDWSSDYQKIVDLLDSGEEEEAWDMLWNWAATQHEDALFAVSGGIMEDIFHIPGAPTDGLADHRFILIFGIYSMNGDEFRRQLVLEAYEFLDPGNGAGSPLVNCLRSDNSDQECIMIARQYDIIPDFYLFREEIDSYNNRN